MRRCCLHLPYLWPISGKRGFRVRRSRCWRMGASVRVSIDVPGLHWHELARKNWTDIFSQMGSGQGRATVLHPRATVLHPRGSPTATKDGITTGEPVALGGGSVPRKSGSGALASDQCCRIKRCRPDSTHRRIVRRLNGLEKNDERHTSRKWNNGRSACFHRTCLWFCHGPLPRLPEADTNPGAVFANMCGTHKETQISFRVADA